MEKSGQWASFILIYHPGSGSNLKVTPLIIAMHKKCKKKDILKFSLSSDIISFLMNKVDMHTAKRTYGSPT